jgi:hypothetical protein
MTKKERLEDLGILCEKLYKLGGNELFDLIPNTGRAKDAPAWFRSLDEEKQDELIYLMARRLFDVENEISECWSIAKGDHEC